MASDSFILCQTIGSKAGHPKHWEEYPRGGPHRLENSNTENASSGSSEKKGLLSPTAQTHLHPQEERKTEAARNTDYDGSKPTGTTPARFRTSSRYPCRQELLWVQAKEIHPRRNATVLQYL